MVALHYDTNASNLNRSLFIKHACQLHHKQHVCYSEWTLRVDGIDTIYATIFYQIDRCHLSLLISAFVA